MPDQESMPYQKPRLAHVGDLCDLTSGGSGGKRESKSKSKSSSSKKKKRYGLSDDLGEGSSKILHAGLFVPTAHAKSKSKRP